MKRKRVHDTVAKSYVENYNAQAKGYALIPLVAKNKTDLPHQCGKIKDPRRLIHPKDLRVICGRLKKYNMEKDGYTEEQVLNNPELFQKYVCHGTPYRDCDKPTGRCLECLIRSWGMHSVRPCSPEHKKLAEEHRLRGLKQYNNATPEQLEKRIQSRKESYERNKEKIAAKRKAKRDLQKELLGKKALEAINEVVNEQIR